RQEINLPSQKPINSGQPGHYAPAAPLPRHTSSSGTELQASRMELVANWSARPVFITSTFQDMQAERDWLWDFVFPAIEERLRRHRRHLEWIDLRLGAGEAHTETEAEREAQVLKVCLD